jgi:hypothetical protein
VALRAGGVVDDDVGVAAGLLDLAEGDGELADLILAEFGKLSASGGTARTG